MRAATASTWRFAKARVRLYWRRMGTLEISERRASACL